MEGIGTLFPVSDRNLPLLAEVNIDTDIVCLENYCKWYGIYLIRRNGSVEKVPPEIVREVSNTFDFAVHIDHYFHPALLAGIAKRLGAELDPQSEEIAAGRWAMEVLEMFE